MLASVCSCLLVNRREKSRLLVDTTFRRNYSRLNVNFVVGSNRRDFSRLLIGTTFRRNISRLNVNFVVVSNASRLLAGVIQTRLLASETFCENSTDARNRVEISSRRKAGNILDASTRVKNFGFSFFINLYKFFFESI